MSDVELIFVGDHFYSESKSVMSSIYKAGSGERYDWGFVQRDLKEGKEVTIRPATDSELGYYTRKLLDLKQQHSAQTGGANP